MHRTAAIALVCASVFLAGCGGKLAQVTGKVTLDDRPLERGTVTFHPVKAGPLGIGALQPGGTYQIKSGDQSGVPPGDYQVTVVATADPPKPAAGAGPAPEAPPALLTPAKYGKVETSGLRFTVPAGGGSFPIPLKSQ